MKNQVATALAIALVVGLGGLSAVPTAMAVPADCNEEFQIPDNEPTTSRILLGDGEETGREDVKAADGDEEVTVRLDSSGDRLEFGVFYLDGQNCTQASDDGLSNCSDAEVLDTGANPAPQKRVCQLDAPDSGTREYFFHMVNQQDDPLEYTIWESS